MQLLLRILYTEETDAAAHIPAAQPAQPDEGLAAVPDFKEAEQLAGAVPRLLTNRTWGMS